jgi:phosphohistidine swiveling domain-containing protein
MEISMNWFVVEKAENTHYLFAASPLRSISCEMEEFGFPSLKHAGTEYIKESGNYVFVQQEWEEAGKIFLPMVIENPEKLAKVHQEIESYGQELLLFCREKIIGKDFTNYSDQELVTLYEQFEKIRNKAHIRRGVMWILETCGEIFTNYLLDYLNAKIKENNLDLNPGVAFAVLATPLKKSAPVLEKEDFLELAVEFKDEEIDEKRLKEHCQKYCWLPYGLSGPAWDYNHFEKAMQDLLENSKENLQEMLTFAQNELVNVRKQKDEILSQLKIDEKHLALLKQAEESIYVKSSSKDAMFYGYYAVENLFKELAKRLSLSLNELRYLLPWEIGPALLGNKLDREELKERCEYSFHYIENGESRVYVGEEARKFVKSINLIRENEINIDVSELKGNCARPGYAKGLVKIINNPADMEKMNEGDVLVSHMTDPEIVIAMKKAAAIVTDMGGITCHAAIVSRELGKPCVIGTKIATKVFQDGDLVEVDADKGIVRKIK